MIEELEKTESQWKNLPTASRNRALIKKWKDQAQVYNFHLNLYMDFVDHV